MIARALLKVGYSCNNNCVFCHSAPHRGVDSTLSQIQKKIREAVFRGAHMLVLSGGEPTIRTDLIEIADSVQQTGMRLGLVTNGRMLVYEDLTEGLLRRGLETVYLSLCGPEAGLHDRHVGCQAFGQISQALTRLAGRIPELTLNVVVTAWNLEHLADFLPLAEKYAPLRLKFSMIEPEGNALSDFEGLVPQISQAAARLQELFGSVDPAPGLTLAVDGFPSCLIPDHLDLENGLREDGFFIMSEAFENGWYPIDDQHKGFGTNCRDCSFRRRCKGVFLQYLEHRGDSEFVPVNRPVPNSFNLEPTGDEERLDLRSCPVLAQTRAAPDPVRGLMVQTGDRLVQRYRIDTRDFSDQSIHQAVRVLGQVYRDLGEPALIDDFPRQLNRLRMNSNCRKCAAAERCGGVWQEVDEIPFQRARDYLHRLLGTLSGRVLDVGCGLLPYQEALKPAIQSGKLAYLGIDPHRIPGSADPGFELLQCSLEEFNPKAPPFDTVLSIRSLNHLSSTSAGVRRLSGLTRQGGRLILAEDTVFGVIRPPWKLEQIKRTNALPFEHRSNLCLEEAVDLLNKHNFQVGIKKSPRELGSTLWIVVGYKS